MQTIQYGTKAINARHVEQFHIQTNHKGKRSLVFRSVIGVPNRENGDVILLVELEDKTNTECLIGDLCNLLANSKRINLYLDAESGTDKAEALDEDT